MTTNQLSHRIGEPDEQCHYPVYVHTGGPEQLAGTIFRWHRAWFAVPVGTDTEVRIADASKGDRTPLSIAAAQYLADEVAAGRITAKTPTEHPADASALPMGPAPLLHPRLRDTPTNRTKAAQVREMLAAHEWDMLSGYPGADNPVLVMCQFDGWTGVRYISHLRGRNGNPPSPFRHPGCLSADEVRARISAYQK